MSRRPEPDGEPALLGELVFCQSGPSRLTWAAAGAIRGSPVLCHRVLRIGVSACDLKSRWEMRGEDVGTATRCLACEPDTIVRAAVHKIGASKRRLSPWPSCINFVGRCSMAVERHSLQATLLTDGRDPCDGSAYASPQLLRSTPEGSRGKRPNV